MPIPCLQILPGQIIRCQPLHRLTQRLGFNDSLLIKGPFLMSHKSERYPPEPGQTLCSISRTAYRCPARSWGAPYTGSQNRSAVCEPGFRIPGDLAGRKTRHRLGVVKSRVKES